MRVTHDRDLTTSVIVQSPPPPLTSLNGTPMAHEEVVVPPPTRVLSSRRPPARVWLACAATFQPGLADARSEHAAKVALTAAVVEMHGDVDRLGPAWGDMRQTLTAWRNNYIGVMQVDGDGLPQDIQGVSLHLRGPLSTQVCCLTSLTHLDLSNNQLTCLPNAIGRLSYLVWFNLSSNWFEYLPDAIGSLTRLQGFNLSDNHLRGIPGTFSLLTSLRHLDLTNNRLTYTEIQTLNSIKARDFPHCTVQGLGGVVSIGMRDMGLIRNTIHRRCG